MVTVVYFDSSTISFNQSGAQLENCRRGEDISNINEVENALECVTGVGSGEGGTPPQGPKIEKKAQNN